LYSLGDATTKRNIPFDQGKPRQARPLSVSWVFLAKNFADVFRASHCNIFKMMSIVSYGHYNTQHNDTQHNDTQHNDTQHNEIKHNNTQHNEIQHNDTQHNDIQHNDTQRNST
jgi:hypothetical protein